MLSSKNTFSSREGYLISNPYYSIYDTNDWLWILGENKLSSEHVIGEKEVIIQRFDGANFFTLKIPDTFNKKIKEGHFFRHKKNGLYLKLYYKVARAALFFINTETLTIDIVEEYNTLNEKYIISEEYYVNDKTRLILTSKDKFYSAELQGLSLKFIDSISFETPIAEPFLAQVRTTDEFSIVKLLFEKEGCFLDKDGKITQKITKNDFIDKQGTHFFPNRIHNVFKVKESFYYYFDAYKNVFKYEKQENKFVEIPNTSANYEINKFLNFDKDYKKAFLEDVVGDYEFFKFYSFNNFETELITKVKIKNFSKKSYKEFGKDLIVLNGNRLESYSFNKSKIKTFLKGRSIRTVKNLKGSKYIVATDSEGVYIIDVKKNTEKKIQFLLDHKEIAINFSRDIYVEKDNTIIINDSHNLYTLDSDYNVIKERSTKIIGEEIIKLKDTIFTADQRGKVFKYSIKGKTYTKIANTDAIVIKEFATDGRKIFATTSDGVFEYENGTFNTYEFENEKSDNLLSITYEEEYGVLVSTKLGKIYKYDLKNKKLNLFYEDELNASIVGMVADNNNNLWLNTYAGIVSVNPSTKKVVRFTRQEGVYELEGNRFSTYKDAKGNILMGSYKGLSFFDPENLVETSIEVQPKFTSISFFDVEENRWKVHSSPSFLKNVKKITLPSLYQRFSATVSVYGEIDAKEIRYRYRLLDEENNLEWFTSFSGNEILFANLAAGAYTLQIEALSASKSKIGERLELKVVSEVVFYKRWGFMLLFIIVALGIVVYVFYQYRLKQKLFSKNEIALNEARIKSAMMLEIHHRIKNNLQIVSGLLGLQMVHSTNEELKLKLQDSQGRIESIAGIHNVLYNSDNQNSISVKNNVENIITYYKTLFPIEVTYTLNIEDVVLNMDKATPFALLLNELINNSNKHAFTKIKKPQIHVNFKKNGDKYTFEYFDNGNFTKDEEKKESMGMRIIGMMNTQLKGNMNIEEVKGFKLTLHF
ncbi:hypothetical protein CW731_13190 [Polaribacter sp. ALD11]|nr:hypothetical protein CW731_13190 [Polaribacter sp. ALD11]